MKEMIMTTEEKLKEIKQSFRPIMNGITAQSMRQKGVCYHLNWGASLVDLETMSREYGKDYDLALALWKENIRECKLLATMIMPVEQFTSELATQWLRQSDTLEIIEAITFRLTPYLTDAVSFATELINNDSSLLKIAGCHTLSRYFILFRETTDNVRVNSSLLLRLHAVVDSETMSLTLRKAAMNLLDKLHR